MTGFNEIRCKVLAKNKQEFDYKLYNSMRQCIDEIIANEKQVLAIQVRDADEYDIEFLVNSFKRADGQYVYQAKFCERKEILEAIKPFCKEISISFLEKDLEISPQFLCGDEEYKKRFGYIEYCQINMKPTR